MLQKVADILIVEDNPADVRLLREALSHCNAPYRLRVAEDGAGAVELLQRCTSRDCPDLVILDLSLPRIGGYEVLAAIRSNETTATVPVIVLSASQDRAEVERAYDAYANCFIAKPSEVEDLVNVVLAIESFWLGAAELPTRR